MLDLDIILEEIEEMENRETSYATIQKLAWLYIVKDHIMKDYIEKSGE